MSGKKRRGHSFLVAVVEALACMGLVHQRKVREARCGKMTCAMVQDVLRQAVQEGRITWHQVQKAIEQEWPVPEEVAIYVQAWRQFTEPSLREVA